MKQIKVNDFLDKHIEEADTAYLAFEAVRVKIEAENLKNHVELMYGVDLEINVVPKKNNKTDKFYGMGIGDLIKSHF